MTIKRSLSKISTKNLRNVKNPFKRYFSRARAKKLLQHIVLKRLVFNVVLSMLTRRAQALFAVSLNYC